MSLAADAEVMTLPTQKFQEFLEQVASFLRGSKGSLISAATCLGLILLLVLLNLDAIKLGTLLLSLLLALLSILAIIHKPETRDTIFATLLALLAFLLIFGCEILFIKDHFSGGSLYRMNTVFKFHYQAWLLLSLASGFWLKWIMENAWPHWNVVGKGFWGFGFGLAVLGAGFYPVLTFTARMNGSSVDNVTIEWICLSMKEPFLRITRLPNGSRRTSNRFSKKFR